MSMITALRNLASATKLKEGSLDELVTRIEKMKATMSDVEKVELDTLVADSFASVSARLDEIELEQAETTVNRLRTNGGSSSVRRPTATSGFRLPKDAA